ncbi:hypothetical protein LDENG_00146090 [Lucifuga dentata]|nr:hypothetical protein LDENG_00146090 [Lucifuga dentata]
MELLLPSSLGIFKTVTICRLSGDLDSNSSNHLDAQRRKREEAQMVADAFRIAFEQQLRKRSEQFLLLAEANLLKTQNHKPEGVNWSSLISVNQRLRELLPASCDVKMPDDLLGTLYRLLDLLNDKEEALAHQKKVSIMLAHSAEELQRQLHLDSHCHQPDSSQSKIPSMQTQDLLKCKTPNQQLLDPSTQFKMQPQDLSEFNSQSEQPVELRIQPGQHSDGLSSRTMTPGCCIDQCVFGLWAPRRLLFQRKAELESMWVSCSARSGSISLQEEENRCVSVERHNLTHSLTVQMI